MNTLRVFAATLSLLILSRPSSALARGSDHDPDTLIMRGLELRRMGKSEEALELFRRAHASAPGPRTLGQMGLVESSLQLWTEADAHLTAALTTPDDGWVHKNRQFLEQAVDRAREHIGELVITGPPGARIAVAGRAIGALPLLAPIRLVEGDVAVSATSEGSKTYSVDVSIKVAAYILTIRAVPCAMLVACSSRSRRLLVVSCSPWSATTQVEGPTRSTATIPGAYNGDIRSSLPVVTRRG